jgi:ubiquinone/menaquinone biosynthesis C-methylase UbiE
MIPPTAWLVLDPDVVGERAQVWEGFPTSKGVKLAVTPVIDVYNCWLGAVVVLPATEAFLELLHALSQPTPLEQLVAEFDGDDGFEVAAVLEKLAAAGFVHVLESPDFEGSSVGRLRANWIATNRERLRTRVEIDLDASEGDALQAIARAHGQDVTIHCGRLEEHQPLLERLVELVQTRNGRPHSLTFKPLTLPERPYICELLLRVGATLYVQLNSWPRLTGSESLALACRYNVAVVVEMSAPWSAMTLDNVTRCVQDLHEAHITGLRFQPRAEADTSADITTLDKDAIDRALDALEDGLADFSIVGFPDDDVIVGLALPSPVEDRDRFLDEMLRRHLRRRVQALRAMEEMFGPLPSSEADARLVDPEEDPVTRDAALLKLAPGALVADICCSAGRTARRLSRYVEPSGLIVGVEKEQVALRIGRSINDSEGYNNIQFRRGLAQHIPLANETFDAVVCDWSFNILLSLGIAEAALREMVRILRPGGRLSVMQVISQFKLADLAHPQVYGADEGIDVAGGIDETFEKLSSTLSVVMRKLWVSEERTAGVPTRWFRRAHLPRLFDQIENSVMPAGRRGLLCYTIVAEKTAAGTK